MRAYFYYIFGSINSKTVCQGPFATESQANEVASSIRDWDDSWSVERFKTSDLQKAKSMYRAKMSQYTHQLAPTLLPIRGRKVSSNNDECSKGVYD